MLALSKILGLSVSTVSAGEAAVGGERADLSRIAEGALKSGDEVNGEAIDDALLGSRG